MADVAEPNRSRQTWNVVHFYTLTGTNRVPLPTLASAHDTVHRTPDKVDRPWLTKKNFFFHLAFVSRFIIDVSLILGEKSRDYSMISKLQPITYDQVVITYLSMEPVGST